MSSCTIALKILCVLNLVLIVILIPSLDQMSSLSNMSMPPSPTSSDIPLPVSNEYNRLSQLFSRYRLLFQSFLQMLITNWIFLKFQFSFSLILLTFFGCQENVNYTHICSQPIDDEHEGEPDPNDTADYNRVSQEFEGYILSCDLCHMYLSFVPCFYDGSFCYLLPLLTLFQMTHQSSFYQCLI